MTEVETYSDEIVDNKNKNSIRCKFCNSLILKPLSGNYEKSEFKLPLLHQKHKTKDVNDIETEDITDYWSVENMFIFENIGVSNTVKDIKYLICADCEMGPVGYHDIIKSTCYIALNRVKHDS